MSAEKLFTSEKLSPKQVASMLGVSLFALSEWRQKKKGPPYFRQVGRIYYLRQDIADWQQESRWG